MNLKTISFNAVVAATVVVGAATAVSPANAASFTTSGKATFVNPGGNLTTINFSSPHLLTGSEFTKGFLGSNLAGLTVNGVAYTTSATSNALPSFLTGFQFNSVDAVLNLNAGTGLGKFDGGGGGGTVLTLASKLTGEIRSASGGVLLGKTSGSFLAQAFGKPVGVYSYTGNAVAIPTPALLPGLIAMGVGMMRKRKAEAVES